MSPQRKLVYKCIQTIIPRASTHIFSQDQQTGNLKFEDRVVQDDAPNDASGYLTIYVGDSGSLYWKESSGKAVAIAMVSSKVGPKFEPFSQYSEDPELQCSQKATKLTEDIVHWIKKKSQIPPTRKLTKQLEKLREDLTKMT